MCRASQQLHIGEEEGFNIFAEIELAGLRDQGWLDEASNYMIWKARISYVLDEYNLKAYINGVVVVPKDAIRLNPTRRRW